MPRAIKLTESERKSIVGLHGENIFHREIAKKINRSKTVIANFLKIDSGMTRENGVMENGEKNVETINMIKL